MCNKIEIYGSNLHKNAMSDKIIEWTEKIEYDITYVDNFNFWLDICILFKTVATVFKREGIEFVKNDSINKREEKVEVKSE